MTIEKTKGRIRVYACGGAGVNTGKRIADQFGTNQAVQDGLASIEVSYIDTSRANVDQRVKDDQFYQIKALSGDQLDGSGKIRRENAEPIMSYVPEILERFEPGDLSIVVSSASGGSGSVIAPSIVSQLLERDKPVIVILISSTDSRLDVENSLKTLKSYDGVRQQREKPVVMAYFQNSPETKRGQVDDAVLRLIGGLMVVYSRENEELDSKDLFNFLRFDRVTNYKPQLAALHLFTTQLDLQEDEAVVTVASLRNRANGDLESLPFTPDYLTVGYLPSKIDDKILTAAPIHLVTTSNLVTSAAKRLAERLADLDKAAKARVAPAAIIGEGDKRADNGLVL